jgi:hypothetical protein
VALHPEHFLPGGIALAIIYDPITKTYKNYVVAMDQCLRELPGPNSSRFPAFRHAFEYRDHCARHLDIFLVILDAEIKYRRYCEMVAPNPPVTPL